MLSAEKIAKFEEDGYVVLENFFTQDECNRLKDEISNIIESSQFAEELKQLPDTKRVANAGTKYFLESNNKIRGFLETKVTQLNEENEKSKLIYEKIGHALHVLNPVFREITYNDATKTVLRQLNYIKPVICQSMYIFKQPFIGGPAPPHQDASYLYAEPIKMVGVWIAIEDATPENGCLQFIPGSHKSGELSRRFIRNPNKEEWDAGKCLIYTADLPVLDDNLFVPVPVPAGGVVLIHGLVRHRSSPNTSPKSRHAYTYHVYDAATSTYSSENWLQENPISFVPVYDDTQKSV